jgi:hypothetical protein
MPALVMLILGLLAVGLVIGVVGLVVGLIVAVVALAIKVAPLFLIGYVVVKLIQRTERSHAALRPRGDAWLDVR